MDTAKIEKRIKKIITVLEVFKEDNKISNLEKDLLLGYVRELYDLIRESEADNGDLIGTVAVKKENPPISNLPKVEAKETEIQDVPVKITPTVIEKQVEQPIKQNEIVKKESPSSQENEAKPAVAKKEEVKYIPKKQGQEPKLDLESLFKVEEVTDLAEKLSMSKIGDISKVIGINERIFIVAELFGGDKKFFDAILSKLNACVTFEEAKSIIIHEVAKPMEWEMDDRIKKAQHFVKQVRRKFS